MPAPDHLAANRAGWDQRAPAHAASPDYEVERFVADPDHLSKVVGFDRPRLGSIEGATGVHLQCHIGTDTLSLARLGATMTGLDLSPASLAEARELSQRAGPAVEFVESDLYGALDVLPAGGYDLVYTGVGALCWLPDVERWAAVVSALLAPGGRLFLREGHPVLWALDETRTDDPVIAWPYFQVPEPYVESGAGTYVRTDATFAGSTFYSWNHGLGEILTALLGHGLRVTGFEEHDSVPWEALPGQMAHDAGTGEWRLRDRPERLPASYTLQAVKA